MLQYSCCLFLLPSLLGMRAGFYWTGIGCGVLTFTSIAYYRTGYKVIQVIDAVYATSFTLASTGIGVHNAYNGSFGSMIGVLFALGAMSIYATKSKKLNADVNDPWHVLVHAFGALAFTIMTLDAVDI